MIYLEARKLLLKKLGMRSYTTIEMWRWLKEKGVLEKDIGALLEECKKLGYLNDQQWLESFVRTQRARRYGQRTIALKLMQKGFSEREISKALSEEGGDEEAAIRHLLQSRYRSRDISDPHQRQKVIASLARRGFSLETILKALKSA
ncbi:MAG: recombination regulator RecX [Parachlamydia sp.]|nr:recombination regulator RecX [Parachlamydia sp.]